MDIVGPSPKTQKGNKYILTIQDLLTKYSIGIPMEGITEIADIFVKRFICRSGHRGHFLPTKERTLHLR